MTVGPKYVLNSSTTSGGGKSYSNCAIRGVIFRSISLLPKRSCTFSGTPQRTGDGISGGGMYFVASLNICPANPEGVQLAIATVPRGLQTRTNSAAVTSGRG